MECHPLTTTRSETQYTLYTLVSKKPHKVTELLSIMEDNNFTGAAGKHFYFIILNHFFAKIKWPMTSLPVVVVRYF